MLGVGHWVGCTGAAVGVVGVAQLTLTVSHPPTYLLSAQHSGGMVFTFYKARGLGVGSSLVEEDQLELAKKLEKVAKEKGVKVRLLFLLLLLLLLFVF